MFRTYKRIYGGAWRAGMVEPRIMIVGGSRGRKEIVTPLNPYLNPFQRESRNWFLAIAWENGYWAGVAQRLTNHQKRRAS